MICWKVACRLSFEEERMRRGDGQNRRAEDRRVLAGDDRTYRREAKEKAKEVLLRIGVVALVIVALVIAGSVFLRQQDELRRVQKRGQELQERKQQVDADTKLIEEKSKEIRGTEEIEDIARNELGMLKPGEIVFKDSQDAPGQ